MLKLRLGKLKKPDSVRRLHAKYGTLDSRCWSLLWALSQPNHPLNRVLDVPAQLKQLFPDSQTHDVAAPNPTWLRDLFPDEEVLLRLVAYRSGAFAYYIEAAALRLEGRERIFSIKRFLQALGGKLARLRAKPNQEDAERTLQEDIGNFRAEIDWLERFPNLYGVQLWWHLAMVSVYEWLANPQHRPQIPHLTLSRLCAWLSIPEIGLVCTPATIKAARRRWKGRDWFGQRYPTYIPTPRRERVLSKGLPREELIAEDSAQESRVRFTCRLCQTEQEGTFQEMGAHLRTHHEVNEDAVEVASERKEIYLKSTGATIVSWKDVVASTAATPSSSATPAASSVLPATRQKPS